MNIYRRFVILTASLLSLSVFGASRAQAQVTLLDGGFELPTLAASSFVAGGGTSWTSSGTAFVLSNDYGSYGNTPYGSQYLDLNTTGDSDSQTVAGFIAGTTYVLGVDFADIPGAANPKLTVSISGAATGSSTFTGAVGGFYGNGTIPFQSAVVIFTALTSGSTTFTLTNASGASNNAYFPAIAVDNVALYGGTPAAIPEPTTTAAMLLGAGALVAMAIRRRATHA